MKKQLLIIITIFIIVLALTYGLLISKRNEKAEVQKNNKYYENYLGKELLGTELATIMGKAIEENLNNNVQKDENGLFIENNENSIKIDLKMITIDKTYPMEVIYNNDITLFVQNFNLIKFKCTNIEYHKETGLISKIIFEQIEE